MGSFASPGTDQLCSFTDHLRSHISDRPYQNTVPLVFTLCNASKTIAYSALHRSVLWNTRKHGTGPVLPVPSGLSPGTEQCVYVLEGQSLDMASKYMYMGDRMP
jgi:hypothetical protein